MVIEKRRGQNLVPSNDCLPIYMALKRVILPELAGKDILAGARSAGY